jgi:hypothetical protein
MGLFGSRSPKGKPDPKIRWFGKLPTYADYYSSSTDEDWVVEFHDWILEGFDAYLSAPREADAGCVPSGHPRGTRRLPLAGCAIRLPGSGMTVFASIQDYGGDMVGRPFPLCLYVGVPTEQWPGPTSDQLTGATRLLQDLMKLRNDVVQFINAPGSFKSVFDDRRLDLATIDGKTSDDSWVQAASEIPMADWFNAAGKEPPTEDLGTWLNRVACRGNQIAALESDDFKPTLCFPLAHGIDLHVQAAGWLRWLESRMDLKARTLSVLLTGGQSDARRLTVIARDLSAEDFLLLTPRWGNLRYVDDLSTVEESGNPGGAGIDPGESVEDPASIRTWADFVQGDAKRA